MSNAELLAAFLNSGSAADVSDIATLSKNLGANDYYRAAAAPVLSAKFDTSTWSPAATFLGTAGQSFLGGILNALGERRQGQQMDKIAAVLPQLYENPLSVQAPEGVDPEAFGVLRLSALARQTKSTGDLANKLFVEPELKQRDAAAEAKGKVQGEQQAWGTDASKNPDSPIYKQEKDRQLEEDKRRAEINSSKLATTLNTAVASIPQLETYANDNTKTSDIPFVYKFVLAQDGGVVKEGEVWMVQSASPIVTRFKGLLEGTLNGKSGLTPDLKQQMVEELKNSTRALYDATKVLSEPILAAGESRGAERSKMWGFADDYIKKITEPGQKKQKLDANAVKSKLQEIKGKLMGGLLSPSEKQALINEAEVLVKGAE